MRTIEEVEQIVREIYKNKMGRNPEEISLKRNPLQGPFSYTFIRNMDYETEILRKDIDDHNEQRIINALETFEKVR